MKITLVENLVKALNEKKFVALIKILKNSEKSTIIDIKGQQLTVPFVLDKNKKYIANFNNNVLTIKEIQLKQTNSDTKEILKDVFEQIFSLNDKKKENLFDIKNLFFLNIFKEQEKITDFNNNKNYFFKDKESNFLFIFEIPIYNQESKIFIKITKNKEVFLNIFSEKIQHSTKEKFENDIKEKFAKKNTLLFIKIFNDKKKFFDEVVNNSKKIDIKI
ncbi:MAG: hypothetical protein A2Y34_18885 [Spirochaetes bacterium GWC1_27_15]|nr:MAG: hypothetical protein A2Z98_13755 [Spirochaetes bacterium GWB1_27_13]OHD24573.1 MAG: hypothetical protein A2Y34_18885 [Spirochaetes bacterium GWC1_27_15]